MVTVGGIRACQQAMIPAVFPKKLIEDGCKSLGNMKCVLCFATPLITDNGLLDV